MNIASITAEVPPKPMVFSAVASLLEERKTFGDRRRLPDADHAFSHPLTNRRSGDERRHNFLNKEVFNCSS